jgi:type I restriction enzyme S subunit
MRFISTSIEACVTKVFTWNPLQNQDAEKFPYVDLSSIDKETKEIIAEAVPLVTPSEAPSRARQIIEEGDVLVATVRPNLNGVALVSGQFEGATASTGYCVLRPIPHLLDNKYLFYWVQTSQFIESMMKQATGANYPAVSDRIVKESKIPLPPLAEQQRISAILEKADILRRKSLQAIDLADQLLKSVFLEMFGAPKSQGWKLSNVENLALEKKGSIRTGPFGSQLLHSEFTDEGIAVLGIDNVVENRFRWAKPRFISEEKYEQLRRYTVNPGDVLITIMGTCGRCAVVPEDCRTAINTKHLCCITLDQSKCLPTFLHSYFLYHPDARKYLSQNSKGAIMEGLNMGIIKEMPVPLVPLDLQSKYLAFRKEIANLAAKQYNANSEIDACFSSLSQQAFRGDL